MKLNKWLYGAMALGMMAACSENDVIPTPDDPKEIVPGQTASGYIAVEIKLPTETSTRGVNDTFRDGLKAEYEVKNAMIVLFKGQNEKTATFYRVKDLSKPFFDNLPDQDNITSSYLAAIDVETIPDGTDSDNFYALVILNRNEEKLIITPADEKAGTKASVTIAGTELTVGKSTFTDFLNVKTTNSFLDDDGKSRFFMTNAPLLRKTSNEVNLIDADVKAANIRYLTNLGKKVYNTPEEAKDSLSGCVYVERAVAKVTYDANGFDNNAIKLACYTYNDAGERIDVENVTGTATVKYLLTNTNKVSYIVRNVDFSNAETSDDHFDWNVISDKAKTPYDSYRMVSLTAMPALSNPFHSDVKHLYRTYWCKDPNYAAPMKEGENGDKNVVTREQAESTTNNPFKSLATPMYCKENTFDVANQKYGNSTLAIFEVNFDIKRNGVSVDHLFIKDGDNKKIYLTKEDAAYAEITRIVKSKAVEDAIKAAVKSGVDAGTVPNIRKFLKVDMSRGYDEDGNLTQMLALTNVSLKTKAEYVAGLTDEAKTAAETLYDTYFDTNSVTKFRNSIGKAVPDTDEEGNFVENANLTLYNLLGSLNQLSEITEYTNGVSYYVKPIMHFGDEYTPWDETITGTTTSEVYNGGNAFTTDDKHSERYLGRYGVVRNNWYELNITEIAALGTPTFPDIDIELANDNNKQEKFFAVEIHILSWAKRVQGIKF